jgi:hypothetical protein
VTTWEEAAARAFAEDGPPKVPDRSLPSGVTPPPPEPEPEEPAPRAPGETCPLIVSDHFDLSMVDMPLPGARLFVKQIRRFDAMELVRKFNPPIMTYEDRAQRQLAQLEKELQLDALPRPHVRYGTRLLVMNASKWNDVRWYVVEWEADGDGVIP